MPCSLVYMALNIHTDKTFDEALTWLSTQEGKTKSDVVRELVLERFRNRRRGFAFGALAWTAKSADSVAELKTFDLESELER